MEQPVMERAYFYDHRWIEKQGGTEQCPCYLDSAPVEFVCGFKYIFDSIPKAQASALKDMLIAEFGEYNYYRYCRGEFLTPPAVQERILQIAKELDITVPIIFHTKLAMPCWGNYKIKRKK